MLKRSHGEVRLQPIVHLIHIDLEGLVGRNAIRRRRVRRRAALNFVQIDVDVLVVEVLLEREHIVESMLEFVPDPRLLDRRVVVAGLSKEQFAGDELPGRAGHDCSRIWQWLQHREIGIVLVGGQDRETGIFVDTPGEGRRDEGALLLGELDLSVAELA